MQGNHGQDRAEMLGLQALGWLAETDRLGAFAGATGADLDTVRAGAADPAFLGAVLDFVMSDDAAARAFCEENGLAAEDLVRARAALPGGDHVHWT
ncbi:DUF3572 domain-containing protein [Jannaschia sp. Os4]|uniref:DUF3572 domain-containing protein n=1 Tax=Jannaschia sp. Os4 TaxID=2807617 RepID=UPI00193A7513|nr:DUF3572 domain-containing protein [Jannaschia sp. Os4]MBM2577067.1 DUF3572 domain-containing protein [Jannaschia sp. Os4]